MIKETANSDVFIKLLTLTSREKFHYRKQIVHRGIKLTFSDLWQEERDNSFQEFLKNITKRKPGLKKWFRRQSELYSKDPMNAKEKEYNKVNREYLKKKRGEVFTPKDLVNEMLDKLPVEVWKDKSKKWLDPACGSGNFLVCVYQKLIEGLKEVIVDEEERRKHILENMLFGVDIRALNCIWTMMRLDKEEKYKLNIQCTDSLKYDFKFDDKNKNGKFDIVVGNPPYQLTTEANKGTRSQQLFVKFIEKSLTLTDNLCFVVPSGWLYLTNHKIYKLTEKRFAFLEICSQHFDILLPTCYFYYSSKFKPLQTLTKNQLKLPLVQNLGQLWKRSNINRNDSRIGAEGMPMIETVGRNGEALKHVLVSTDVDAFPHFHKWKVLVNNVGDFDKLGCIKIAPPEIGTSYSVICLGVDTQVEATNLKSYLETHFAQYIIKNVKQDTPNAKMLFSQIPLVDLSRAWTDEELYKHFNLTDEEIKLIEETVK